MQESPRITVSVGMLVYGINTEDTCPAPKISVPTRTVRSVEVEQAPGTFVRRDQISFSEIVKILDGSHGIAPYVVLQKPPLIPIFLQLFQSSSYGVVSLHSNVLKPPSDHTRCPMAADLIFRDSHPFTRDHQGQR